MATDSHCLRCGYGVETSLHAVEARAMLEGLCLAWDKWFQKLELECDNGLLVETILVGGDVDSRMTELRLLHSMLIRPCKSSCKTYSSGPEYSGKSVYKICKSRVDEI
ncbi:hypothetical protein Goarm_002482 [Gossypium armourianum]|uniref:RNase H type-1 domain-containing protein n=1 Tax=Gossypium armourianum TaxID=34283 RepID=A0A7J9K878_9ROSI|nr:hypothetical protein [Gossypium armourianum]